MISIDILPSSNYRTCAKCIKVMHLWSVDLIMPSGFKLPRRFIVDRLGERVKWAWGSWRPNAESVHAFIVTVWFQRLITGHSVLQNVSKFFVIALNGTSELVCARPSEFACDVKNDRDMFTADPHIMWSSLKTAGLSWPFQLSIFHLSSKPRNESGGVWTGTAPSPFPSPSEDWKNAPWKMWSGSQESRPDPCHPIVSYCWWNNVKYMWHSYC